MSPLALGSSCTVDVIVDFNEDSSTYNFLPASPKMANILFAVLGPSTNKQTNNNDKTIHTLKKDSIMLLPWYLGV